MDNNIDKIRVSLSKMKLKINEPDWEANQVLHLQELEEARNRAMQMERTMRWWSDCTANWREKWSKVRNERNLAREEVKRLQTKLDHAVKESNTYRRQKQTLEAHNEQMRKELEQIHVLLLKHVGQWDIQLIEAVQKAEQSIERPFSFGSDQGEQTDINGKDSGIEEYILNEISINRHDVDVITDLPSSQSASTIEDTLSIVSEISEGVCRDDLLRHRLFELQSKLDEMTKTVSVERDKSQNLFKSVEKLESDMIILREKYEDLKISRQDTLRELQFKETHDDTLSYINFDLFNETIFREDVDRRLADVRAQLERLQVENVSEYDKQFEFSSQIKSQPTVDNELGSLQLELWNKNKELDDLKQLHVKLKKTLSNKMTELSNSGRRIEQYEVEVEKLRLRVEELKRDLSSAEDEADANNNIRKLQRTNYDLQEQIENLYVQIQHLQSRLKQKVSLMQIENGYLDEQTDDDSKT